jgi:hypothetical protein
MGLGGDFSGYVSGPLLEETLNEIKKMSKVLIAFFKNDRDLRAEQSANEPLADGFQQGSNNATADTTSVPPNGSQNQQQPFSVFLDGLTSTAKKYSYVEVLIESSSGSGRYSLEPGVIPTPSGAGHQIPSGGTTITIPGVENIKNFKMIAETGQTLTYTMQGFV